MPPKSKAEAVNTKAVILARAGAADRDGRLSISNQLKLCRTYALSQHFDVEHEFSGLGLSSKQSFDNLMRFLQQHPDCGHVIVERTDRLARNLTDFLALEKLPIKIHLVKEGQIVGKDAPSTSQLAHGMFALLTQYYEANLRQEIKKKLAAKAERGVYPGRAPLGYRNNPAKGSIETDKKTAPLVRRIFGLYATGKYSLQNLPKAVEKKTGLCIYKERLVRILHNPFYAGSFSWGGNTYKGAHPLVIKPLTYQKVQRLLRKSGSGISQ